MILSKQVGVYLNQVHYQFKLLFQKQFALRGLDLTAEQYLVLDLLWDEGTLTQQEIANRMEKDKNSVTKFINALEAKKLLCRINDKQDRRRNHIVLTPEGEALKDVVTASAVETAELIYKDISQTELEAFVATLKHMGENLKESIPK